LFTELAFSPIRMTTCLVSSLSPMYQRVIGRVLAYDQIIRKIIISFAIYVMDTCSIRQCFTEYCFSYNDMFENMISISPRVVRFINAYIPCQKVLGINTSGIVTMTKMNRLTFDPTMTCRRLRGNVGFLIAATFTISIFGFHKRTLSYQENNDN